jgi:parvulin-like peptidyl-prolyl isomerase
MRRGRISLIILLSAAPAFALSDQAAQGGQGQGTIPPSRGVTGPSPRSVQLESGVEGQVPLEAPVVTLDGPCEQPRKGAPQTNCKSVVTRAEVDTLIDLLEPNASPAARRQLAVNYARLVAASVAANRKHLEKDPLIAKQLQVQQKLVSMQVLANAFYRELEAEAKNVPISEVENYYLGHRLDFERGEVRRLLIPKQAPTASAQSLDVSKLRAKAEELRARAAAGEDFDNLQQAANEDLGIKTSLPATKLSMARRTSLPAGEEMVFDLDSGQVTQVIDSPSAFVVLKLESKKILSLEDAKPEILPFLQRERAKQVIGNATGSAKAEFNLQYFGLLSAPELFPPPQITGLAGDRGMQSEFVQRSSPRRPMLPRRREINGLPVAPR